MLHYRVMLVVGTRPEAIKLAPVAQAFAKRGHEVQLVLTGQHPQLDTGSHGFGAVSTCRLGCRAGGDPRLHAEQVAAALQPLMHGPSRPDLVLVQGDTSSALGGALAASLASLPLGHVEAGLRSHDFALPWPEEGNRVEIDRLSDLLFAATEGNAAHLRDEQVGGEVHVTGNTAIDALLQVLASLPPRPVQPSCSRSLLVTCHRRENWGAAFTPVALALLELARDPSLRIEVVLHPNPAMAKVARLLLGEQPGIHLLAPMDHSSMIDALRSATVVLSDSGGIQEEAPALGIPLLVLRSKTERPEGVESGNSRLVGTDGAAIVREVRRLLDDQAACQAMARPAWPFGDGRAAARIAALAEDWLEREESKRERLIA